MRLLPIAALVLCLSASADVTLDGIDKFVKVDGLIYRGGRPTNEALQSLKDLGFRTILNLDNDSCANKAEAKETERLGMTHIAIPLPSFTPPQDKDVLNAVDALADRKNYPIFVHCKHGEDRTGMVAGLFRFFAQHWSAADAYKEMLDLGFHRALIFLDHYYREATDLKD